MAYSTRSYARSFSNSGGLPPAIKWLLISNVGIYVLGLVLRLQFLSIFALRPVDVATHFYLWQLVTYMFLHGSIFHILFNMLTLWWFGVDLERTLGTRKFLNFYFICGVGAGVCVVIGEYLFGNPRGLTIGSSGAIYGILMAYAVLWPDQIISMFGIFPMKMKWFVAIVGAIAFIGRFYAGERSERRGALERAGVRVHIYKDAAGARVQVRSGGDGPGRVQGVEAQEGEEEVSGVFEKEPAGAGELKKKPGASRSARPLTAPDGSGSKGEDNATRFGIFSS